MIAEQQIPKDQTTSLTIANGKRHARPCVLLVEDDRSLRRYLEVVLRQEGYQVFTAADGLEAMRISLRSAVDVVVTDAIMPHLNGYELCRFLRNTPQFAAADRPLSSSIKESQPADCRLTSSRAPVNPEDLIACGSASS